MAFDHQTWFEEMRIKAHDQHDLEIIAHKHDEECEWDIEFRMCHCHRRKRLAEGKVEAPAMYYTSPICEGCGGTCSHNGDGFECYECKVDFGNTYDEPGTWQDEYASTDTELRAQRDRAVTHSKEKHHVQ